MTRLSTGRSSTPRPSSETFLFFPASGEAQGRSRRQCHSSEPTGSSSLFGPSSPGSSRTPSSPSALRVARAAESTRCSPNTSAAESTRHSESRKCAGAIHPDLLLIPIVLGAFGSSSRLLLCKGFETLQFPNSGFHLLRVL